MKLLAIDTSTEHNSVCYYDNGIFKDINILGNGRSSSFILKMIDKVANLDNLNGLVYSRGPGAFTGVRVGISISQGLSLAKNIPMLGFSSLEIMEFGAKLKFNNANIICAIDARMGEIYLRKSGKEILIKPDEIKIKANNYIGLGTGFKTYPSMIKCSKIIANFYPQSKNLIKLALKNIDQLNFSILEPLYLRNNVAKKSLKL